MSDAPPLYMPVSLTSRPDGVQKVHPVLLIIGKVEGL